MDTVYAWIQNNARWEQGFDVVVDTHDRHDVTDMYIGFLNPRKCTSTLAQHCIESIYSSSLSSSYNFLDIDIACHWSGP